MPAQAATELVPGGRLVMRTAQDPFPMETTCTCVVDAVEAEGGLVNEFEGEAALCVFGDPVNEAARLTDLAKDHPGRVLASEATVRAAGPGEREHWARDAEVELRGRGEPTTTWARR